jgi:hypothetical protein
MSLPHLVDHFILIHDPFAHLPDMFDFPEWRDAHIKAAQIITGEDQLLLLLWLCIWEGKELDTPEFAARVVNGWGLYQSWLVALDNQVVVQFCKSCNLMLGWLVYLGISQTQAVGGMTCTEQVHFCLPLPRCFRVLQSKRILQQRIQVREIVQIRHKGRHRAVEAW